MSAARATATPRLGPQRKPGRPPSAAGPAWSADPYADALRAGRGPLFLRRTDGWLLPLDVERWCAEPDPADLEVLGRCEGTVLDVGCGPGRLVAALGGRALGVDVSEAAVAHTVRRGGRALQASVFDPLPGTGRWDTALLLDGNIGIGGDPHALLARLARLLTADGLLLVETAPYPDVDERLTVQLTAPHGTPGAPFPWARLGTPALLHHAHSSGWRATDRWSEDTRAFVALRPPRQAP
ncbi:class I SAM-dependent methyltransferase [Streptomyces pseudogriseolus]|uniref:class I SAM-dependent methyltransferase n=1 Tax=Streptomyces pseudogriseolus TaxID=36817 RepID=UPI003FA24657